MNPLAPIAAAVTASPVIVALDFPDAQETLAFVSRLPPASCRLKVGKELFTAAGPALVEALVARGFDVFLDLKYHDIPNTVASACRVAASLGVWMVDLHASGGRQMMETAREALANVSQPPLLIAVTVLTSMTPTDLTELGLPDAATQVMRLAALAQSSGMDGVVCSAQEAGLLRQTLGPAFTLVTPGIRPQGSASNDQHRIMTPAAAMAAGSSYLVIGRPITQAVDPVQALQAIHQELGLSA